MTTKIAGSKSTSKKSAKNTPPPAPRAPTAEPTTAEFMESVRRRLTSIGFLKNTAECALSVVYELALEDAGLDHSSRDVGATGALLRFACDGIGDPIDSMFEDVIDEVETLQIAAGAGEVSAAAVNVRLLVLHRRLDAMRNLHARIVRALPTIYPWVAS